MSGPVLSTYEEGALAPDSAPSAAAAARSYRLVVALCVLVAMVEGYDLQAAGVAALKMGPALHIARPAMGAVFSLGMLGLIVGASASGWLADRVGRKPILIGAVVAFGLFSVLTGFVHDRTGLVVARVLTGLGLGGAMPNLIAIAADISAPNRRAATATLMVCGMPLGGVVVSALAGPVLARFGWPAIFLIGGAAPLVITPLLATLLPEVRPQAVGAPPPLGTTLFGEGRASASLLLWTAYFFSLTILYLMLNWLPVLVVGKGLSPAQAPEAALTFNIGSILGGLALGWAADRFRLRLALGGAYLAMVVVMLALAFVQELGPVLCLSAAAGFVVVGAQFALYGVTPAFYPPAGRASGVGVAVGFGRFGSIAGPLAATLLLADGANSATVIAALVPCALISGAAIVALDTGKHRR